MIYLLIEYLDDDASNKVFNDNISRLQQVRDALKGRGYNELGDFLDWHQQ